MKKPRQPPRTFSGDEQDRRDALLLGLLKTPPQPRPKRERDEKPKPKAKKAKTKKPAK